MSNFNREEYYGEQKEVTSRSPTSPRSSRPNLRTRLAIDPEEYKQIMGELNESTNLPTDLQSIVAEYAGHANDTAETFLNACERGDDDPILETISQVSINTLLKGYIMTSKTQFGNYIRGNIIDNYEERTRQEIPVSIKAETLYQIIININSEAYGMDPYKDGFTRDNNLPRALIRRVMSATVDEIIDFCNKIIYYFQNMLDDDLHLLEYMSRIQYIVKPCLNWLILSLATSTNPYLQEELKILEDMNIRDLRNKRRPPHRH